jgi:hypothetical protein
MGAHRESLSRVAKYGNASDRIDHLPSCGELTLKNENWGSRIENRMENAIFHTSILHLLYSILFLLLVTTSNRIAVFGLEG